MLYAIQTLENTVISLNLGGEDDILLADLIDGELSKKEVELINFLYPNNLPQNYKSLEDLKNNP